MRFPWKKTSSRIHRVQKEIIREHRRLRWERVRAKRESLGEVDAVSGGDVSYTLIFLWTIFLMTAAYALVWSPYVQVRAIIVVGAPPSMESRVQENLGVSLQGYFYRVFPRRSFFFIDEERIVQRLLGVFPEAKTVVVTKSFPRTVEVRVSVRDQFLSVCSAGPCFIIDERGMIRGNETDLDISLPRVRVIDMSGAPFTVGAPAISENFSLFSLSIARELLSRTGIHAEGDLMTVSRFSGTVRVPTEEGWSVIFDTTRPLENSLQDLKMFLDHSMPVSERSRLDYVDIRSSSRVYYRLKGDGEASVETVSENGEVKGSASETKDTSKIKESGSKKKKKD